MVQRKRIKRVVNIFGQDIGSLSGFSRRDQRILKRRRLIRIRR